MTGGPCIRAVIADDEPLARRKIRLFAQGHPEVEIVAECGDGASAVRAIRAHAPGLLFLDVRMPGMSGLEVLRAIPPGRLPHVVFTTAHGEYAVEAFAHEALDYLLKPFDRPRFDRTIERVLRARRTGDSPAWRQQMLEVMERLAAAAGGRAAPAGEGRITRFAVPAKGRTLLVDAAEVRWIAAEGKYVRLHATTASHLVRLGITDLERRLDPRQFRRIHRSTIVSVRLVREIHRGVGDDSVVVLQDGTELAMSRRYRRRVEPLV